MKKLLLTLALVVFGGISFSAATPAHALSANAIGGVSKAMPASQVSKVFFDCGRRCARPCYRRYRPCYRRAYRPCYRRCYRRCYRPRYRRCYRPCRRSCWFGCW